MKEVSIIGVDLAKQVFQLHGATSGGEIVFRKKLSRKQFLVFMQSHPTCIVAMEACATAHYWGRTLAAIGHEVRLPNNAWGPQRRWVKGHCVAVADRIP